MTEACRKGSQQSEWSIVESDRTSEQKRKQKGSSYNTGDVDVVTSIVVKDVVIIVAVFCSLCGFAMISLDREMSLSMFCKSLVLYVVETRSCMKYIIVLAKWYM